ncbi:hypothetical protein JW766_01170 [Candidatus Dojkabacteria bacterium]|nr:hypothetical protein [Candidatus Dojkabacteria bacterium]
MRKTVKILILTILFFILGYTPVFAISIPSPITLESIGELITKVSGVVTPLAVLGFIFSVIYAGFVRMTAGGNPEKEAKSMKIATAAAVGFAIIALAPLIVKVLASLLGVQGTLVS